MSTDRRSWEGSEGLRLPGYTFSVYTCGGCKNHMLLRKTTTLDTLARTQILTWLETTGMTQVALGKRIGRNQAWVSRYLSAEFDADLDALQRMADVFGHTLWTLLGNLPADGREAELVSRYRACRPAGRRAVDALLAELTRPHDRPRRRGRS